MKLFVRVKPGSSRPGIEKDDESHWIVRVREPATDGRANAAVLAAVAADLGIARSCVQLQKGAASKWKTFAIEMPTQRNTGKTKK